MCICMCMWVLVHISSCVCMLFMFYVCIHGAYICGEYSAVCEFVCVSELYLNLHLNLNEWTDMADLRGFRSNRTAKYVSCACVRGGKHHTSCRPGDSGKCQNTASIDLSCDSPCDLSPIRSSVTVSCLPASHPTSKTLCVPNVPPSVTVSAPPPPSGRPPLSLVMGTYVITLSHVQGV